MEKEGVGEAVRKAEFCKEITATRQLASFTSGLVVTCTLLSRQALLADIVRRGTGAEPSHSDD